MFACGNGIPLAPDRALVEEPQADMVIMPEPWLGPYDGDAILDRVRLHDVEADEVVTR
jgi:hypothetical protein